jgi:membrane protease YdiL (CAAX protease family)
MGWVVVLNYLLSVAIVSVLFALVYNGTGGSLLSTVLLHASLNSVPAVLTRVFLGDPGAVAVMSVNWVTAGLKGVFVAAAVAIHGAGYLSPSPCAIKN